MNWIDFYSLPIYSQIILVIGFSIGIVSLIIFLRYPIILILMKLRPDYREFIKKTLEKKKKKK